jgi:hypothetical protein
VVGWGSLTGLEGSEGTHSAGSMNKQIQFKNSSSLQCVLFRASGGVSGDRVAGGEIDSSRGSGCGQRFC